ncbi:hypothetical protein CONCODRAFT_165624 [Conidiobolus coronatus NRRL 28638]|uniref:PIN domain-containing protein n=1 Tax=Conidiobolus coronatus (strain ATCC 28846 / CBS 209.66 / NRRL 28638) TaxID=796925 RepID=A0A137P3F4_CONC2|nr:hypothetical protein CONCODRAFT_165624 [Conidiobolus coronatus NRRL 28638]|eukprot:KXN69560.1 hypothetical protein CONCODRAFT_165624 [Conidiobolus coronatus NRRL 28638]
MLNQVSTGKLFTDDNLFLQPLNNYVAYTSEKFARYIQAVTEVPDPEHFFNIDEFLDLANTNKPVIYISPQVIYSLHRLIADNKDFLVAKTDDLLLIILKDLGDVPIISTDQAISNKCKKSKDFKVSKS